MFINGKLTYVKTDISGYIGQLTDKYLTIGANGANGSNENLFIGYISSMRFIIGSIPTGYQTSSTSTGTQIFTPPTAPVTLTSQGALANSVVMLTNFNDAAIVDSTAKNVIETVGTAKVNNSISKYGTGTMSFDGSSSCWAIVPHDPSLNLSTGSPNWTMECWVYVNSYSNSPFVFNKGGQAATYYTNYGFQIDSGGTVYLQLGSNSAETTYTFGTITTGSWVHLAATRTGSTIRTFFNGTLVTNTTIGNAMTDSGADLYIGCLKNLTTNVLNGHIEDLRITKGTSRYTATFTPSTRAFPDK
jgi:hypothetical protein